MLMRCSTWKFTRADAAALESCNASAAATFAFVTITGTSNVLGVLTANPKMVVATTVVITQTTGMRHELQ